MIYKVFSEFKEVRFFDSGHKYLLDGVLMESVTTIIKKYGNKFNTEYWTTYKALQALGYKVYPAEKGKKIGVNGRPRSLDSCKLIPGVIEESSNIREQWREKARVGREFGSAVHNYMENAIWGKYSDDPDPTLDLVIIDLLDRFDPIRTEMIVYNNDLGVAGQVDLLAVSKETGGVYIIDYKTDDEISMSNKYENFKSPVDYLEESTFNKYKLQLNIYRNLLESKGVRIEGMIIIHLCKEPKWHDIPLVPVKELLNDYDKKRNIYV